MIVALKIQQSPNDETLYIFQQACQELSYMSQLHFNYVPQRIEPSGHLQFSDCFTPNRCKNHETQEKQRMLIHLTMENIQSISSLCCITLSCQLQVDEEEPQQQNTSKLKLFFRISIFRCLGLCQCMLCIQSMPQYVGSNNKTYFFFQGEGMFS